MPRIYQPPEPHLTMQRCQCPLLHPRSSPHCIKPRQGPAFCIECKSTSHPPYYNAAMLMPPSATRVHPSTLKFKFYLMRRIWSIQIINSSDVFKFKTKHFLTLIHYFTGQSAIGSSVHTAIIIIIPRRRHLRCQNYPHCHHKPRESRLPPCGHLPRETLTPRTLH